MKKVRAITLEIQYDDQATADPIDWDWGALLDLWEGPTIGSTIHLADMSMPDEQVVWPEQESDPAEQEGDSHA